MDVNDLNIFLKYLEKQNIDMKMINSFLSSLKHNKMASNYDKIKEIVYRSQISSSNYKYCLLLDDISYDFLLKNEEIEQEYIITFITFDSGSHTYSITNFLKMEEYENRFKYLPFIINEIKQNNKAIVAKKNGNKYTLNKIYLLNENHLMDRNIKISELLTYIDFVQKKNVSESNENLDSKQITKEKILKTFNFHVDENKLSNNNNDIIELKRILNDNIVTLTTNPNYCLVYNPELREASSRFPHRMYDLKCITDRLVENIVLIVNKKDIGYSIIDILEYDTFVKKYLPYYPETLKYILTNKKYRLSANKRELEKILVIDFKKIKINIMDINNILCKILEIL